MKKIPVDVYAFNKTNTSDPLKKITPYAIRFEDGRKCSCTSTECVRASNIEAGLYGLRFKIQIPRNDGTLISAHLFMQGKKIEDAEWYLVQGD